MVLDAALPDGTAIPVPGIAPRLSATPGSMRWLGPALGAHTDEVLLSAGYSAEAIADLREKGAV